MISKGDRVEALDCERKWYLGSVVAIRRTKDSDSGAFRRVVKVHFDGWSSEFDEWIQYPSSNIRIIHSVSTFNKTSEITIPANFGDVSIAKDQSATGDETMSPTGCSIMNLENVSGLESGMHFKRKCKPPTDEEKTSKRRK